MSGSPFILVPWQRDFMPAILDYALAHGGDMGRALFIFPHARPARYLERLIREEGRIKKPCLMPECLTVSQLFQHIWEETQHAARPAGALDRIGLLLEALRAEQEASPGLISLIPTADAKAFFPWGRRLDGIFEDCFNNLREPVNFLHLEGELMPFAAAILSRLGNLFKRYIAALEDQGLSTPGFMAKNAVDALKKGVHPRFLASGCNIYICGFHSPSGAEEALFKQLWREGGATLLIHADPALAGPGAAPGPKAHWCCSAFSDWRLSWGAGIEVMPGQAENTPKISFYAGYDVHSQLAFLRSGIHKRGEELGRELEDTAVILPDTGLLLPVLHHIQADDVNISMGYPMSNTALQRFLESILSLHENAREGFYWRDCIRFLRQPYIKMLDDSLDGNGRSAWRELLLQAEHSLREGRRYVDLALLLENCLQNLDVGESLKKVKQTWENVRQSCLDAWQELPSLAALAEALQNLVNLLVERGESIWPRFPIDAECLARFASSLIPELKNSALSHEALPQSAIFAIFRELAGAERIPFDAYPLTVLQIMGLLESRLLSFKSVFIMDATDDLLPGGVQTDPLLPDSLRAELGLPDAARRQRLTAYYFFRLLQSAEEVHIFWQEGVEPQGVLDAKKLRSRFVEELIWREEQKAGRLLEPQRPLPPRAPELPPLLADGPLRQIGSRLSPFRPEHRIIPADGPARERLRQFLSSGISATQLNAYMRCPALFYYRELAKVAPARTVMEDEDPASVGTLFHDVLKDYYGPQLGRPLQNEAMSRLELARIYKKAMAESQDIAELPADARLMLGLAGERRLRSYLERQPAEIIVKALESPLFAPLSTPEGKSFQLLGRLDRIDERIQPDGRPGLVILDYKTGRVSPIEPEIWNISEIWQPLEDESASLDDREFFNRVADTVRDVQLPFYLYLASFGRSEADAAAYLSGVCNAGWVALRDQGDESFIFPDELSRQARTEIIENQISNLLEYLLRHLVAARCFFPRPDEKCEYCDYHDICIVLSNK